MSREGGCRPWTSGLVCSNNTKGRRGTRENNREKSQKDGGRGTKGKTEVIEKGTG